MWKGIVWECGEMNRNVECGMAYFGSGKKGIGMLNVEGHSLRMGRNE